MGISKFILSLEKWNLSRNLFRSLNYNKYFIFHILYTFAYYEHSVHFQSYLINVQKSIFY